MTHIHAEPQDAGAVPRGAARVAADAAGLETQLPALRVRLVRHARYALHDDGLAEDLVQDTLMVVVEQHATRRGDSSLLTWATAILKHKVADWYRSPTRRRMVQFKLTDPEKLLYHNEPIWRDGVRVGYGIFPEWMLAPILMVH